MLEELATEQPEPLKSWLNVIADHTWNTLLKNTSTYLDTTWQSLVLPIYNSEIKGRYPIFTDARESISLKNFNDFFGPNGTVGAFFITYVQPFVNMESNYWSLKKLNGQSVNISRKSLDTFIRASLIQQMFFTDNYNTPGFQFTLTPLSLSANIQNLMVNVGGQIYNVYQHTQHKSKKFFWPGNDSSFVSIIFTDNNANSKNIIIKDPWAFFRLLDQSNLKNLGDPRAFNMTLKSENNTASFKLSTNHRINPLVPGVIGMFRAPAQLSQ